MRWGDSKEGGIKKRKVSKKTRKSSNNKFHFENVEFFCPTYKKVYSIDFYDINFYVDNYLNPVNHQTTIIQAIIFCPICKSTHFETINPCGD